MAFNVYPFIVKLVIFRSYDLEFYHCHYNCLSFWLSFAWSVTEAYSEPCQTYKMKRFVEIVNGFHPLSIFSKRFISQILKSIQSE